MINPNITPAGGLVEGNIFEIKLRPDDADGSAGTLSALAFSVKPEGGSVVTLALSDFETGTDSAGAYYKYDLVVSAGVTQLQGVSSGGFVAVDLAHFFAEPKPL